MTESVEREVPYVGLRPFFSEDHRFFFGRERAITELLDLMQAHRFLGVLGGSGSGKSSLVRAGLIPALTGGHAIDGHREWFIAQMKPGDAPLANLASALIKAAGPLQGLEAPREEPGDSARTLTGELRDGHTTAVLAFLDRHVGSDCNVLLLVDQLEEVFHVRTPEAMLGLEDMRASRRLEKARRCEEAADFIDLMLSLSTQQTRRIHVATTLRTDMLGESDQFRDLSEALDRGRYLMPRLTHEELRDAMERPARLLDVTFTPRLSDMVLNALGDGSDRLPVFQHALRCTWSAWRAAGGSGPIDIEHFIAAGGLDEALSRDAEAALRALTTQGVDIEAVGRVFRRLTATDADQRRVCAPARLSELASSSGLPRVTVELYVKAFSGDERCFLLSSDDGLPDDPRIEIVHSSLIGHWNRLRAWVDEERHQRDQFLDLVKRARARAADPSQVSLLDDEDLSAAQAWRTTTAASDEELTTWAARYQVRDDDFAVAMAYLEASERNVEEREARTRRAKARRRWSLLAFSFTCLMFAVWAWRNGVQAERERDRRRLDRVVANARLLSLTDPTTAALMLTDEAIAGALDNVNDAEQVLRWVAAQDISLAVLHPGHASTVSAISPDSQVAIATANDSVLVFRQGGRAAPVTLPGAHTGVITHLVFSDDGTRILTASADSTARIWRADGSPGPIVLRGHTATVYSAKFDHAGTMVVTASADSTARVWSVDGSLLATIPARDQVLYAEFSPDGRRVVTASMDNTARVWDRQTMAELATCRHRQRVKRARFSHAGTRIVTASSDGTARVCSANGSGPDLALSGHTGEVNDAAFSNNDSMVVTASNDRTARVWSIRPRLTSLLLGGHTGAVLAARFSPGDSLVATVSTDSTARLWYADNAAPPIVLRGHRGSVAQAVFTGTTVWTTSSDSTVRAWRSRSPGERIAFDSSTTNHPRELLLRGHQGPIFSVDANRAGTLLVTASADKTARLWQVSGGAGRVLPHRAPVNSARFSHDGDRVVTASDDATAGIWDLAGNRLATLTGAAPSAVLSAQFDTTGGHVVTSHADGTVNYWTSDGRWLRRLATHAPGSPSWSADFNREGTMAVSSSWDGTVHIASVNGDRPPLMLTGHRSKVHMARFSPAGDRVASASDDGTARIWLLQHPDSTVVLRHAGPVLSVAFNEDGSRVVTASRDRTVRVWSAEGDSIAVFAGHLDAVWTAAFGTDGKSVVSTSYDGTVRLWPLADGGPALTLAEYPALVTAAVYRSSQGLVVATSSDRLSLRWLGLQRFIDALKSATTECLAVPLRVDLLNESGREAGRRYAACERGHGRRP